METCGLHQKRSGSAYEERGIICKLRWMQLDQDVTIWMITSFVFNVIGRSIFWSSKKQSTVVISSVEAEYIASVNVTKNTVWLCIMLQELDYPQSIATVIYADNQGCIALAKNPVSHSHAKHIDIWHHFICNCVKQGEVELHYVPTKDILVDIFTKTLPHEVFEKFCTQLGMLSCI